MQVNLITQNNFDKRNFNIGSNYRQINFEAKTKKLVTPKLKDEFAGKVLDKVVTTFKNFGEGVKTPIMYVKVRGRDPFQDIIRDYSIGFKIDTSEPDKQKLELRSDVSCPKDWDIVTPERYTLSAIFNREGQMIAGNHSTPYYCEFFERINGHRRIYSRDSSFRPLREDSSGWVPITRPKNCPQLSNASECRLLRSSEGLAKIFYEFAKDNTSIYAKDK